MSRRKNVAVSVDELDELLDTSTSPLVGELDFESAVELFLKEQRIRHRVTQTIEWHRENLHTLRVFLERQGLSTAPNSVTTKMLKEDYVLHMLETLQLSPVTANGRIRTARA